MKESAHLEYIVPLLNGRFSATCFLVNNRKHIGVDLLMDTGAIYTCISADKLDGIELECTGNSLELRGINGKPFTCMECVVNQFIIGRIDAGKCSVWVFDDTNVELSLLGTDILSRVDYRYSANMRDIWVRYAKPESRVVSANVCSYIKSLLDRYSIYDGYAEVRNLLPDNVDMSVDELQILIDKIILK